jgi:hypothetical protein
MSERRGVEAGRDEVAVPRRRLTIAVLLCLVGAGVAVFATSRTWSVDVTPRPAPLPSVRVARTGGDLLPWVPALALVGLAGAGAVLATRGLVRRLIGALLVFAGAGVAAGGVYGTAAVERGGANPAWPALCALGGLLAAVGGLYTTARGHRWPGMGARYERPGGRGTAARDTTAEPADGSRVEGRTTTAAWEALDRGEDPTITGRRGRERTD